MIRPSYGIIKIFEASSSTVPPPPSLTHQIANLTECINLRATGGGKWFKFRMGATDYYPLRLVYWITGSVYCGLIRQDFPVFAQSNLSEASWLIGSECQAEKWLHTRNPNVTTLQDLPHCDETKFLGFNSPIYRRDVLSNFTHRFYELIKRNFDFQIYRFINK